MFETNNMKKAIQDAQQEHGQLLETLKGYEKTKLRVAQLESFINMGKALLGVDVVAEEIKPVVQFSLLPQDATPAPDQSKNTELTLMPLKEGVLQILTESDRALSLAEIADEFRKRHWKLSEKNGRQVLRGTMLRFTELVTRTVKGYTAYYRIKQA